MLETQAHQFLGYIYYLRKSTNNTSPSQNLKGCASFLTDVQEQLYRVMNNNNIRIF